MLDKTQQIRDVVAWLREHFDRDLLVIDHWEADLSAVGVALGGDPKRLVYIAALEQPGKFQPGKFFVELETAPAEGVDPPYTMVGRFESVDRGQLRTIADDHLNRRLFDQDGVAQKRFPCPCCGHHTLEDEPPGTFTICFICDWEDDPVQSEDETYEGGANTRSLRQARERFKATEQLSAKLRPSIKGETTPCG